MLCTADSNQHPTLLHGVQSHGDHCLLAQPSRSLLLRLFLWFMHGLALEVHNTSPVRVYYKFDSGCWRSRSTRQLQKVY
jgi:hypothetical protein